MESPESQSVGGVLALAVFEDKWGTPGVRGGEVCAPVGSFSLVAEQVFCDSIQWPRLTQVQFPRNEAVPKFYVAHPLRSVMKPLSVPSLPCSVGLHTAFTT